jgi:ABC-2 type transport system permease protein
VIASREELSASPDWSDVFVRLGGLFALAIATAWVATRAFRAYQKSV